ncbi:MAG: heme exporter protein CcmD [Rhizobiaceae bacterium]|nr:heme exporter protein CcmD [Rhizobiaceae bacterium]
MSAHAAYVTAAYALSAAGIAALIGWVWLDYRGRKRDLAMLVAAGIRRRSERARDGTA